MLLATQIARWSAGHLAIQGDVGAGINGLRRDTNHTRHLTALLVALRSHVSHSPVYEDSLTAFVPAM
jgi:hypothetical protein